MTWSSFLEQVDQYTDLLIEMFTDRDMKCQEFLIAKAVEIIDIETLYSLDAHSLSFIIEWPDSKRSPHEEFDSLLKFHLFNITLWRKRMVCLFGWAVFTHSNICSFLSVKFPTIIILFMFQVKENVDDATFPFTYLLVHWNNIMPLRGHFDYFIEVAELRRKAEGTRFINRDHFMWAFRERGYGTFSEIDLIQIFFIIFFKLYFVTSGYLTQILLGSFCRRAP